MSGKGLALTAGKRLIKDGSQYDPLFPVPTGHSKTLSKDADVDPQTVVFMQQIVNDTLKDTVRIAPLLKGDSVKDTCNHIHRFITDFIQYAEDEQGIEQLRRPSRSWADRKKGVDCDCMSIFASSVLTNLNIPHAFRITKYEGRPYYQHVYVVVPKSGRQLKGEGSYYTIDGVIMPFDHEKSFSSNKDFPMNGLPIHYLNGVGNAPSGSGGLESAVYNFLVQLSCYIAKRPGSVSRIIDPQQAQTLLGQVISCWHSPHRRQVVSRIAGAERQTQQSQSYFFDTLEKVLQGKDTLKALERSAWYHITGDSQVTGLGKIDARTQLIKFFKDGKSLSWGASGTYVLLTVPRGENRMFKKGKKVVIYGSPGGYYDGEHEIKSPVMHRGKNDIEGFHISRTAWPQGKGSSHFHETATLYIPGSTPITLKQILYAPVRGAFLTLLRQFNFLNLGTKLMAGFFLYEPLQHTGMKETEWRRYAMKQYGGLTSVVYEKWAALGGEFMELKDAIFNTPGKAKKFRDLLKLHPDYNYYRYYDNWGGKPHPNYTTKVGGRVDPSSIPSSLRGLHRGYSSGVGAVTAAAAATLIAAASPLIIIIIKVLLGDGKVSKECEELLSKEAPAPGDDKYTQYQECLKKMESTLDELEKMLEPQAFPGRSQVDDDPTVRFTDDPYGVYPGNSQPIPGVNTGSLVKVGLLAGAGFLIYKLLGKKSSKPLSGGAALCGPAKPGVPGIKRKQKLKNIVIK